MADAEALLSTLEWFTAALTTSHVSGDARRVLAEDAPVAIGVTGAAVMLLEQGRYVHATASLEAVAALQRVVEADQSGPCVEAGNGRRAVAVRDVRGDGCPSRFPAYVEQAERSGIRAVAAVPIVVGEATIGALGLYDEEPRDWSDADLRTAAVLANIAGGYLLHEAQSEDWRRVAGQLQRALDSRIVIEQAKGVFAVQRGIGLDEAFVLLRKQARDDNRLLREVCAEVVNLHQS